MLKGTVEEVAGRVRKGGGPGSGGGKSILEGGMSRAPLPTPWNVDTLNALPFEMLIS